MRYNEGKSGDKLSVLGFGCMRFPRKGPVINVEEARKLVETAFESGVNYFDTAYLYPGSERALAASITGIRDKIFIADKMPTMLCVSASDFSKFFSKSLERLKTDHIDYYLMHMLTEMATWEKLRELGAEKWIAERKKNGAIRHVGFSFHGEQSEFLKIIDAYDWDFCQIQYNYIDAHNQAGQTGLLKAVSKGMPVMAMEPLLGGRLTNSLPKRVESVFREENPKYSFAEWALRWLWDQREVTLVLSGMNGVEQICENVRVADETRPGVLTAREREVFRLVRDEFNAAFKVRCTGCHYCMPCPHGVDIPTCFATYNAYCSINKITGIKQYMFNIGGLAPVQHYASQCVSCGKCEPKCPQRIPISQTLKEVAGKMESFWFKPMTAAARAIIGVNAKARK
ncbi:MAG: aldo/keto reductase [Clostridiales bacterium]|jgi:predicted aldo/keto reductase-like oxidoreductase|nr:aldo/keto reductase [Clostridiales bacterium]